MAGLFDLVRGLRGAPSSPEQIAEMDRVRRWRESLMQALVPPKVSDEEIARAMEYRKSVMRNYQGPQVPPTREQAEADRLAGWEAAVGYSPQDVRGGMKGRRESEGALNRAMEWASLAPFGATVFHGSPHRFEKFDLSKIGTGEGTQSRGFGVYVAENPDVAKTYVGRDIIYGQQSPFTDKAKAADIIMAKEPGKFHDRTTLMNLMDAPEVVWRELGENTRAALKPAGNLYKVDLPDEQIAKMLDLEKPLKDQPEHIKKAIAPYVPTTNLTGQPYDGWAMKAGDLVESKRAAGTLEDFSEMMRKAGIPGFRYLDQGSRVGGKGTSNFVVFDPELLKILERE